MPVMNRMPQSQLVEALSKIVGPEWVSIAQPELLTYSGDAWPKRSIWKMNGDVSRFPPDCVVWPANESELCDILKVCTAERVPVIPYGGGSGVCGGTLPIHGGVVVDMKRQNRVLSIDSASQLAHVQAGINGQHLEDTLNAAGFTLGHFPSSIMCSTLGGWLAARSAGQFSSRYGKIEDMVVSLRVVLPDGSVMDTSQRGMAEPDWTQLIVGSEGTLGLITSAQLKLHPKPEIQELRGFRFPHLADGLRAMRLVMQTGLKPMVLRLYDPFDSMMAVGSSKSSNREGKGGSTLQPRSGKGLQERVAGKLERISALRQRVWNSATKNAMVSALMAPGILNRVVDLVPSPCLLIIGIEGPSESVQRQMWKARQVLTEEGGMDAGVEPGEAWLARRYAVSFKGTKLFGAGAFVDTMEVATTWDRLEALYETVHAAMAPHALVMAHFSHAYREGCSIYFTFASFQRSANRTEVLYDQIWSDALTAVHSVGATASHHHGVGLSKRDAMVEEHGEMLRVWRAMKQALDPHGIMNPGKLFPDRAGGS